MVTGQDTQSYSKHKEGIKTEISSKSHPAHVKKTGIGKMIQQSSV
jgi:ribosomal protein L31